VKRRQFEQIVDQVLDELPEWVVERIDNLVVVVEESPTFEQDPDGELLGIYEGVSRSRTTRRDPAHRLA
jgi:predicted Zn-dependent protease with MMP-like domain